MREPYWPYWLAHRCKVSNGNGNGHGQVRPHVARTLAIATRMVDVIDNPKGLDTNMSSGSVEQDCTWENEPHEPRC